MSVKSYDKRILMSFVFISGQPWESVEKYSSYSKMFIISYLKSISYLVSTTILVDIIYKL